MVWLWAGVVVIMCGVVVGCYGGHNVWCGCGLVWWS